MKFFKRFYKAATLWMPLYNPFKPHICQLFNGKYAVRKLTGIGWQYLDNTSTIYDGKRDDYWLITASNILKYCGNNLKVEAEARLNEYNKPKPKFSKKV